MLGLENGACYPGKKVGFRVLLHFGLGVVGCVNVIYAGVMLYKRKVVYDGMEFDSSAERDRYLELSVMQERGEISGLCRQVEFELLPRQSKWVKVRRRSGEKSVERFLEHRVCYTCDFVYRECGVYVVEDVKSWFTRGADDSYPIRRKLMVRKIQEHNARGHGQWLFREYIVGSGRRKGRVLDR